MKVLRDESYEVISHNTVKRKIALRCITLALALCFFMLCSSSCFLHLAALWAFTSDKRVPTRSPKPYTGLRDLIDKANECVCARHPIQTT